MACANNSSLRGAVLSSSWQQAKDISAMIKKKIVGPDNKVLPKIPKNCLKEAQLCYSFSEDRLLVASMTDALRDKAVVGAGSNLSVAKGKLDMLKDVIKRVEAVKCGLLKSIDLFRKVKSFYELRKAIKNNGGMKYQNVFKQRVLLLIEGDIGHEEFVAVKMRRRLHCC